MKANIEIKKTGVMQLACISHIGEQQIDQTFGRLIRWAGEKGLLGEAPVQLMTIYHDSYKITAAEKVRRSICIVLTQAITADGEVSLVTLEPGKFVVGHFEISAAEFGKTWSELFVWINQNGYLRREGDVFELYQNDYREHPEKKFIVDMYIPVK